MYVRLENINFITNLHLMLLACLISYCEDWYTVEPGYNEGQGTGKISSLKQGFVVWKFFYMHFAIAGAKNIVRYELDVVI